VVLERVVKAVVLGASKGLGRAIARVLAEQGAEIYLLGRDRADLAQSAADLELRGGQKHKVAFGICDLESPANFHDAVAEADRALSGLDTVIVTAGLFAAQDKLENDLELTQRLLTVNFSNTVVFCEHARQRLIANGGGTLCVVSSVAGERGRKPVILYGASKAGLSAYLEGLDHKYYDVGLRVVTVKPGFMKTTMTEGLKPPPFAGEPEQVAKDVYRAIQRHTPVLYTPRMWALVMFVIRLLPRFVMRKIGF
jgi:decaprenylphospho-beta-D-erythro-pentofuranosid-2-ulose 2-reductase